jgi:acyl-CoA thioester hydrolase
LDFQIRRESGESTTNGRIVYVVVSTEDYAKREIPPLILDALGEPHPLH